MKMTGKKVPLFLASLLLMSGINHSAKAAISLTLKVTGLTAENKECLAKLPKTTNLSDFQRNLKHCNVIFVGKGMFRPIDLNELSSDIIIETP